MQRKYRFLKIVLALLAVVIAWLFWPMQSLFPNDYSTLVLDSDERLLRATLADDEQYRFPTEATTLPDKYVKALLAYEDKRFYRHLGVDPVALVAAVIHNLKTGKRARGGSTITMQVTRLADPKPRTYFNKVRECFVALRLSIHRSKSQVLTLYATHAPMGRNIVGIQSASHIYFGKSAGELTWAEAALFVVLPNSPSLINIERERPRLIAKRNGLLKRLHDAGAIDRMTYTGATSEPLPNRKRQLPFAAPHFTRHVMTQRPDQNIIVTTLDSEIQTLVESAASHQATFLSSQGIHNLAVIVAETQTGKVRAYLGSQGFDAALGGQVDGVQALRSTGSLLKPFLVAKVLDRGPYTTESQIRDVPTFYGTFAPQNASKEFGGLASVEELLTQSLNVPSVRLLNAYGHRDFYDFLVAAGMKNLFRSADGYGLALILGGAEASLFELTRLYRHLGNMGAYANLHFFESDADSDNRQRLFSIGASWLVLNSLTKLNRPGVEHYWDRFDNRTRVAWKTGTSYGQKDGWAIGVNQQWTIGVWVGNFNGEGNASISGAGSAAPLLFALFNSLTRHDNRVWFDEPFFDLAEIDCCRDSGFPAGRDCIATIRVKRPRRTQRPGQCPFHQRYLVDLASGRSVCSLCWEGIDAEWQHRFILPPAVKDIVQRSGRAVDSVPMHLTHCPNYHDDHRIDLIYPVDGVKILVPRDLDGKYQKVVLFAKHERPSTYLFWYLNGHMIGETVDDHRYPIALEPGAYKLTVQDEEGFSRSVSFVAYRKPARI